MPSKMPYQVLPKQAYCQPEKLRAAFVAFLGTVVEYYDYALYGFCVADIAATFFPSSEPRVALIKSLGVFAVGSLAKPLGSLVLGSIGDRRGRALALKGSMAGIVLPTLILALLPSYAQLGVAAPLLLIACRFVQGFFVAGESDGIRIFVYETLGRRWPYLSNGLTGLAAYAGIFLASCVAQWLAGVEAGWRWGFLLGGLVGLCVVVSRQVLMESEEFAGTEHGHVTPPLRAIPRRAFMATFLLCGAVGGAYHIAFVYLATHLGSVLQQLTPAVAAGLASHLLACYIPVLLVGSYLADRWGAKPVLWVGLGATLLVAASLGLGRDDYPLWLCTLLAAALGLWHGPGYVLLLTQFPVNMRYRGIGLGHGLGSMLFSGTAPLVCAGLWQLTAQAGAPMLYLIFLSLLASVGISLIDG